MGVGESMPILGEADSLRKRRLPVASVIFAVVVLLLVGLIGWSCYRPIELPLSNHGVAFGHGYWEPPLLIDPKHPLESSVHPGAQHVPCQGVEISVRHGVPLVRPFESGNGFWICWW